MTAPTTLAPPRATGGGGTVTTGGHGGAPARRAVVRWAWRLFRREWRQQLLVLALITVAVGATVLGAAVATNTPPALNIGFGTADYLVTLPGNDHLAADIAAMRASFGTLDVIESAPLATGSVQGADVLAQDPHGAYGRPMLSLLSGRYPIGAREVAVTPQLASALDLRIGSIWHDGGKSLRVVGIVENPQNLLDEFALVPPGQLSHPTTATVLFDATAGAVGAFHFPGGAVPETPPTSPSGFNPAVVVFAVAAFGFVFVGLVASAGFTVMAQRRLRAIGMIESIGATDRNVRLVMIANGAITGVVAALLGTALGFAAWYAYLPHLETSSDHVIDPLHLPWWVIGSAIALAVLAATAAARRPARAIARIPVVAALAGQPAPPMPKHRSAVPGAVLAALGAIAIAYAGPRPGNTGSPLLVILGILSLTIGGLLFVPVVIPVLAAVARRVPVASRLALRDIVRYRARSGSAVAAVSLAITIAAITCIAATARYSNALDYFGPNLPANQLVVYAPGFNGPGGGAAGAVTNETPAQIRDHVNAIAGAVGTHNVLELDQANAGLQSIDGGTNGFAGQPYLATPALLHHYGISQSEVGNADVLTSRSGLNDNGELALISDPNGPAPGGPASGGSGCQLPYCLANPKIVTLAQLPADTSDPNLLVTPRALRELGVGAVAVAWVVQTSRDLTPQQLHTARQMAAEAGLTVEVKNDDPSLTQVRDFAAAAGILLALGVLAMSVGLIRSETAGDLRTLTATGATARTRRTLTAVTAGALGMLGACMGVVIAYVACIAFFRSRLYLLGHVPVETLLVILLGLPTVAALGGWLLAGRQPAGIARSAIE